MEKQIIVKSNLLIEASYNLSVQEQRIILLVASMINATDEDFKIYRFGVKDFISMIGLKGESQYREVKKITKGFFEKCLIIKDKTELQTNWFSSCEYFDNEGYVELQFSPKLKPYLLQLKERFTRYQLKHVIKLRGAYSIRIYELLKQYESIGERYFELDELRDILQIDPSQYVLYGHLKDKILNKTQKELNNKTDISFTFKEKKKQRKVIGIMFFIKLKQTEQPDKTVSNLELYEILQTYFLQSPSQAKAIVKKWDKDPKTIEANLAYVEKKFKSGAVKNIGAYLQKAIKENIQEQRSLFEVDIGKTQTDKALEDFKKLLEPKYQTYVTSAINEFKDSLSPGDLAIIQEQVFSKVKSTFTGKHGLKVAQNLAFEDRLKQMASISDFETWKQQQVEYYLKQAN